MAGLRSHIRYVKRGSSSQFLLYSQAKTVNGGYLSGPVGADNVSQHASSEVPPETGQISDVVGGYLRGLHNRWVVEDRVKDKVALHAVMHHASAASDDRLVAAEDVVGEAETRLWHDATVIPTALGQTAIADKTHSFQRIP